MIFSTSLFVIKIIPLQAFANLINLTLVKKTLHYILPKTYQQ